MSLTLVVPRLAVSAASLLTGAVLGFVVRARRLNGGDLCGVCGTLLPLEHRFRFHGRTVCANCARRTRYIAMPRVLRVIVLLLVWGIGLAAVVDMLVTHDPEAPLWAPLFVGLVIIALLVGAVPAPTPSDDQTASTLRRLHALRTDSARRRSTEPQ